MMVVLRDQGLPQEESIRFLLENNNQLSIGSKEEMVPAFTNNNTFTCLKHKYKLTTV